MPTLLQLNCTANWGSTGRIAEGIGLTAMSRGWDSVIAYGRLKNASQSTLIKVGNKLDVYAHYFRNRLFDGEGLGSARATKLLIDKISKISPDIIQLHNIHDHWLNYPLIFDFLQSIAIPIVWTFHDCWAFTGGCYHFEEIGCDKWMYSQCADRCPIGHNKSSWNYEKRRSILSQVGHRLHIIAVSKWLESCACKSFLPTIGAEILHIHNGIDVRGCFKISNSLPKERMVLCVSNVWSKNKGFFDIFKLRELLPSDVAIYVVGVSEGQMAKLPNGVQGVKRTADVNELVSYYQRASVFVNPTYCDSFPTVNIEALACGTPIVTYRTGGSPEAIDEKTGIVVDKGNVDALAAGVMSIIDNTDTFSKCACRQRAEMYFNQETQFEKYVNLYESLIK